MDPFPRALRPTDGFFIFRSVPSSMNRETLSVQDIIALGFMTFALFVGAGNIIFPPMVGFESGSQVWPAAAGFLITAVGLPIATVVAMARAGGGLGRLTLPLGRTAGMVLAVVCYLAIGPLFAVPRTAVVTYEAGIAPALGHSDLHLLLFSIIYFVLVLLISLKPGRLLDSVGKCLAPLKIAALAILGVAACLWPAGTVGPVAASYQDSALSQGMVAGYQTMDTLGALMFGLVIANAIRSRGITSTRSIARYTVIAGLIAGTGLVLVYLSLFQLGNTSHGIASDASNGAALLHAYVQHTFGTGGSTFLAVLIGIACLVTAVGLITAFSEFFSELLGVSYNKIAITTALFSLLVSNMGLDALLRVSLPVLTAVYPPCIVMILLSFIESKWRSPRLVVAPTMAIALLFGIADGIKAAGLEAWGLDQVAALPLASEGMSWLVPSLTVLVCCALADRFVPRHAERTVAQDS